MAIKFDILDFLSGLTGYVFDKSVLTRIAWERDVTDVTSYDELDAKTIDLLRADLLYTAYLSPILLRRTLTVMAASLRHLVLRW
jgi:hypothetical protein